MKIIMMRNQQLYYLIKALRRYNPNLLVLIAAFWTFRLIFQPNNFQHATLSFELVRHMTFVAHFFVFSVHYEIIASYIHM